MLIPFLGCLWGKFLVKLLLDTLANTIDDYPILFFHFHDTEDGVEVLQVDLWFYVYIHCMHEPGKHLLAVYYFSVKLPHFLKLIHKWFSLSQMVYEVCDFYFCL